MLRRILGVAFSAALLTGCASAYGPSTWTGGYSEKLIAGDTWWVRYGGNGYTTEETVQTYWLYHCAELALSKGYAGFQIITPVKLTQIAPLAEPASGRAEIVKTGHHGGGGGGYVVYGGGGAVAYKPTIAGQIRLLKPPVVYVPGQTFDAAKLKAMLEPYVTGVTKCGGNVCPYVHKYLYPETPSAS